METPVTHKSRTRSRGNGLGALAACLILAGCMQTEPGTVPSEKQTIDLPEDNGRRAGATSSTNWPAELSLLNQRKVFGKADSLLTLYFFEFQQTPPGGDFPIKMSGVVRFYHGSTIPALDSVRHMEYRFQETDTLAIPAGVFDGLSASSDTVYFNIRIESDTVQGWLMDFSYSKKEKRFIHSPFSTFPASSAILRTPTFYFKGNLRVDTTIIPPVAGESEFSFYIPGTPIFGPVGTDTTRIGLLPRGEYPLRLLRLTRLTNQPPETLVEAWEVVAGKEFFGAQLVPGEKVFSVRVKRALNLRKAEPWFDERVEE